MSIEKKPEISFRVFGNSGPLSIYWSEGPYGDANSAQEGRGVSWYSSSGELLGVEFDDVLVKKDKQELIFKNHSVIIKVENSKVDIKVRKNQKTITAN